MIVDSSFQTKDYGQVGASFTKRNGEKKLTESAGGTMSDGAIDYYCSNCKIATDGTFTFNRTELYTSGSDIVIWAFKNGDKYTDTLRLHVPRTIAVSALKRQVKVAPSKAMSLDYQFLFDNGQSVSSVSHPHLLKTINYRYFPADFGVEKGLLFFSGTNYYDSILIDYFVEGLPHVGGQITVWPQYVYTVNFNGAGNKGHKGDRGNSGNSGRGSTQNGQNGQGGGNGYRGNDGQDVVMKLQTLPSGIIKVEIESGRLLTEVYYIDFKSGGNIVVDLSGGEGGEGGDGGDGGSGNNATDRYSAGYGGNGGDGGYGGHGGRGGNLRVYTDSSAYQYIDRIVLFNKGGRGGNGGSGGNGGKGGTDSNARLLDILITGRRGNRGSSGSPGQDGQNGYPMTVQIK
ncbi:MAG: collagen-like protein [Chitinophagaceae bacterium]